MISVLSYGHATALVEASDARVIVDPWLTSRLDRFWVRAIDIQPALLDRLDAGLDAIVLTHHHVDHLHYPSLRLLGDLLGPERRASIPVYYPRPAARRFAGAGMGNLPVELSLTMLGFRNLRPLRAQETTAIKGLDLRAFPSRVAFPELSYLLSDHGDSVMIGQDSVLHPATFEWFTGSRARRPDVALLPAHSYVPPNILTERRLLGSYDEAAAISVQAFDRYVATIDARLTVPFACGWQVAAREPGFSWCNQAMYPFTPGQARDRLASQGRETTSAPPGRRITAADGEITVAFEEKISDADVDHADRQIRLDPATAIPAFAPDADRVGQQTVPTAALAERFAREFVGTETWWDRLPEWQPARLRVWDDTGASCFSVQPDGSARETGAGEAEAELAASTLEALLDGRLLYSCAWGLWAGDPAVLAAVFHHPKFYTRHLARALAAEPRLYIADD